MPTTRVLGPSSGPAAAPAVLALHRRRRGRGATAVLAAGLAVFVVGCGDSTDAAGTEPAVFTGCEIVGGSTSPATATVEVQLGDYVVVPNAASVAAGAVAFKAANIGQRPHELVVVRGDAASALPTDKDGSMAEDRLADLALTGEIEEFPPAESCDAVFDLEPGKYVLLCNLVERVNGKTVAHFRQGMSTAFTVTG